MKSIEFIHSPVIYDQTDLTGLAAENARNIRMDFKWKLFKLNQPSKYF